VLGTENTFNLSQKLELLAGTTVRELFKTMLMQSGQLQTVDTAENLKMVP